MKPLTLTLTRRNGYLLRTVLCAGALVIGACDPARPKTITPIVTPIPPIHAPMATAASDKPPSHTLERLTRNSDLFRLPVEGFLPGVVSLPAQKTDAKPQLALALHGNFDRPEWQCLMWEELLPGFVVLCPRGVARADFPDHERFTYGTVNETHAEVVASLKALNDAGIETASDRNVIVGLSRGAFQGVKIAARDPKRWQRLVLVEGGHDPWTPTRRKTMAGARVILVCGTLPCKLAILALEPRLHRANIVTRHSVDTKQGHGFSRLLRRRVGKLVPWLWER